MTTRKMYILDTNVLIHDPQALVHFAHAHVGIPLTVIEELDTFKGESSPRGFNARESIRMLDALRTQGSLRDGVPLSHGGIIQILSYDAHENCSDLFASYDVPDNRILSSALCAQRNGHEIEFISKDLNMRVKANALGLVAVDYMKDAVSVDQFYKGWRTVQVPSVELKQGIPRDIIQMGKDGMFTYNEYIIAEAQHNEHNYRVFKFDGTGTIVPVQHPQMVWDFKARNIQQLMALDLLFNNDVPVVTLIGPAGTGKTLLVLVAALYKVLVEEAYTKLLVSRPIIPLGPDIGYLPGELQEKLYNWMQPVYDNMELISHISRKYDQKVAQEQERDMRDDVGMEHGNGRRRRKKKHNGDKNGDHNRQIPLTVSSLTHNDKLGLEAITYMRGRSIPYRYIFIDEVQNLTPHEVKTIVSRVGDGSKIVMAGDPYQIDSPYLDFSSNGLMALSERFKGQKIFGTVFLEHSERSMISKLAGELL